MEEHEFDCFILPNYWYHCLNLHGEGNAVYFPIRVRPFLSKLSAKNFVANNKGSYIIHGKTARLFCKASM